MKHADNHYPVLYLLMRTDLISMNPGKAMAQAAHAATDFVLTMEHYDRESSCVPSYPGQATMLPPAEYWINISNAYNQWLDGRTFGTKITVDAEDEATIRTIVARHSIADGRGLASGLLIDPSYPIRDGRVVHTIPLLTCGWVFTYRDDENWAETWDSFDLSLYR